MENKKLLFSVTKNDLIRETFCTGGPGGQHRNAKQNGVRLTHPPSGAVGEGRVHREQYNNEREALTALSKTKEFKTWHKAECARRMGTIKIDELAIYRKVNSIINDAIATEQLLVEYYTPEE